MVSAMSSPAKAFPVEEAIAMLDRYYAYLYCSDDRQYCRIEEGFTELGALLIGTKTPAFKHWTRLIPR